MTRFALPLSALLCAMSFAASLAIGSEVMGPGLVIGALVAPDPDSLDHLILLTQRLPRALMALQIGAAMAVSGVVLQGLTRNPLASPTTLGINAGAAFGLVAGALIFGLAPRAQGWAALAGALAGPALTLAVARSVGLSRDPRGAALILSGALVAMLLGGLVQALLLAEPLRRQEFLAWITGNVNHAHVARLADTGWITALALLMLWSLSRPLSLILLGPEKAASAGVNVPLVTRLALAGVAVAAGSAVAVSGPIAFLGLVVPHLARAMAGASLPRLVPVAALLDASLCLLADLVARRAFLPFVTHTGVVLDLLGGLVFVLIVHRLYLRRAA
ncbi:iron ABC transporter permease [Pararhodobacter sp. CCB-MM2]|uniref:FecCD family ABC transporter permease n=1 Tax=Pararhodobacter sp. CCB-MM2 TaxID=1786003 RepID=UPI000ADF52A1|nr:iron ABC transporter permease [Pararhodobacter sp. CCB-MM2]